MKKRCIVERIRVLETRAEQERLRRLSSLAPNDPEAMSRSRSRDVRLGLDTPPLRPVSIPERSFRQLNRRENWIRLGDTLAFRHHGMTFADVVDKNKAYGGRHTLRFEVRNERTDSVESFETLAQAKRMAILAVAVPNMQQDGFLDRRGTWIPEDDSQD